MNHIGRESVVGNAISEKRFPKCFTILYMLIFPASDYFDVWNCGHEMISPCNPPLFGASSFNLQSVQFPKVQVPLSLNEKLNWLEKYQIFPKVSQSNQESCDEVCGKENLICSSSSFPLVNDCSLMRKYFKLNCQCQSSGKKEILHLLAAFGSSKADPSISLNYYCSLQENPIYTCNSTISTHYPSKRICPCRKVLSNQ
jgi:hypothetical protein